MPKISLIHKNKGGGKFAWYLRRSARVDGKPRVIWEKYLGSPERIAKLIEEAEEKQKPIALKSYPYGRIAALLRICEELNFIEIVNRHTNKKKIEGLTVGEYLFLIILGRAHGPLSKAKTGNFFYNTWLQLLWKFNHKLNSQNFLNHMKYLTEEAMVKVEEDVGKILVEKGLTPTQLIWDTTNNFTYIEKGESYPQKGKSKQKRDDKNIVGLGIAVSKENIPFLHQTFSGNKPDAKVFGEIIGKVVNRLKALRVDVEKIILVIDKGNNSTKNIKSIPKKMHVVGSIRVNQAKEYLDLPLEKFEFLYENAKGHDIIGYRTYGKIFDGEYTIVITYNRHTKTKQEQTYSDYKKEFLNGGKELKEKLENPPKRGKKMTGSGVIRRMEAYIPKKYRSIFKYKITTIDDNKYHLEYWIDEDGEKRLFKSMGKQVLFTDRGDLPTAEIARTYNGKNLLEEDFHWIKDKIIVPITPYFSRLDDPIRVHNFLCVMGILFYRYLMWELKEYKLSREKLVENLDKIRLAIVKDKDTKKVRFVIEEMDGLQALLFSKLDLGRYLSNHY